MTLTIFPIFKFIFQIIVKKIISFYHFSVLPFSLISSFLKSNKNFYSIRINKNSISMEFTFIKITFIYNSIWISEFSFSMIPELLIYIKPSIFSFSFVTASRPFRHFDKFKVVMN